MAKPEPKPKKKDTFSIEWSDLDLVVGVNKKKQGQFHRNTITDPWQLVSGGEDGCPPPISVAVDRQSPGCIYVYTASGWKRV